MIKRWYCTGREVDLERQSKLVSQDSNIFVQIDHGYTFSRRSPLSIEKSSYMSLPPRFRVCNLRVADDGSGLVRLLEMLDLLIG